MNKSTVLLLAVLALATFTVPVTAQESILPPYADKALVEDNLFVGLKSDNSGLQRSCALMLGKIQSSRAVIPLLTALHNNPNESVRIAAAWALCNIGDARGVYAVKMAVKYDECCKVKTTCAWYFENIVQHGTFTFVQPEVPMVATTE